MKCIDKHILAEEGVVVGLLAWPEKRREGFSALTPKHFSRFTYRRIYTLMFELYELFDGFDERDVIRQLEKRGQWEAPISTDFIKVVLRWWDAGAFGYYLDILVEFGESK